MAIEITEVKRRFRYNGVTLPDVAGLSNQQVRDLYSAQYPELMSADIEVGEVARGVQDITFRRAVGTRADAGGRVERYAALLDLQLHGGSDSATGALEEALGRRRVVEAGQAIGEFASAVCVTGERRVAPVALPFPSEGLPPMP